MTANKTCATSNENGLHSEKGERRKEKGEPTPNRVQSSLLELPRCEGGKDASRLKAYFFRPGQDARD